MTTPAPYSLQDLAGPRPKRRNRWLLPVLIAGLVLLAGGGLLGWRTTANQPTQPAGDPTAGLVAACHVSAERQLKAPSTARYSSENIRPGNNAQQFYVDGVVDSQNGFGAQVRSKYYCDATRTDAGWDAKVSFGTWP